MRTTNLNLASVAQDLFQQFQQIEALYLFGSRRFRTGSTRSDIDLLVEVNGNLKPSDLRDHAIENFPAIDPFIVQDATARSCINDSYLAADTKAQLVTELKAVKFWTRSAGQIADADLDWEQKLADGATFSPTVLPNLHVAEHERRMCFESAERNGLPTRPYLGESHIDVANFLCDLTVRMVQPPSWLGQKGQAKNGWTVALKDEYDFQNLFWTVAKPWLPELGREQITICYDNQGKHADFSLSQNRLVIEMKHIKDDVSKAAVGKTLQGLATFYQQHPNVKVILFLILVDKHVALDAPKWETDFSFNTQPVMVITKIISNAR